jgi:hypothetical protein
MWLGDKVFDCGAGQYLIVSVDLAAARKWG